MNRAAGELARRYAALRHGRARGMPSNRSSARTPGIVAADHESGADREQQNPGGKDEDESRMVMIEEKAEEWRRHRRAEVETRIDEPDHRARGSGRSRAAHQQVTRRCCAAPGEPSNGDA